MIFPVYKPVGITSFGMVRQIRRAIGAKKVGHGGTLDPFAEGVLVIGVNGSTPLLGRYAKEDKEYLATLRLGEGTDTLDREGRVVEFRAVPQLMEDTVRGALEYFAGGYEQMPPMYSAKKSGGIRLYKLARRNIEVSRTPRKVAIHEIELISWSKPEMEFRVVCSGGTYVRQLGSDIAQRLGTVGHLVRLVRTRVGEFRAEACRSVEELGAGCLSIEA